MFQISWGAWRSLAAEDRKGLIDEFHATLDGMGEHTGLYSMYGHKGDLMLVHFRPGFEALSEAEWKIRKLGIWEFCEQTTSYVSVVELGLYESTGKVYGGLAEKGVTPHGEEWKAGIAETIERQSAAMAPRLYPQFPRPNIAAFIPWIASAEKTKTGTRCPWKTAPG